jgi:hypothetical protein
VPFLENFCSVKCDMTYIFYIYHFRMPPALAIPIPYKQPRYADIENSCADSHKGTTRPSSGKIHETSSNNVAAAPVKHSAPDVNGFRNDVFWNLFVKSLMIHIIIMLALSSVLFI